MRHIKLLAFTLLTYTNAASVDYTTNGDNWGETFPDCKTGTQSPIDLKTNTRKVNGAGDFSKFYSNIYGKRVSWVPDKSTN